MSTSWTAAEVVALPVTVPLVTAGQVIGRGRTATYQDVSAGEFPVPVLKLGARLLVKRADLLSFLGINEPPAPSQPTSPAAEVLRVVA